MKIILKCCYIANRISNGRKISLYDNAFYLMLNTGLTSLLGFVYWNIMAHYFTRYEVGIGSALISASSLMAIIASLGLGIGLIRYMPEMASKKIKFINLVYTLSGITAIIIAIIYLMWVKYWSPPLSFITKNIYYTCLFIICTVTMAVFNLTDQAFIAGRLAKYVFLKNMITSLLKIPLPIIIFAAFQGFGIFLSTGIAMLFMFLISILWIMPQVYKGYLPRMAWSNEIIGQVLPYSFSNYLANLLNTAPNYIYPLMVVNVLGPEKNAYFYIVWMITLVLNVIPGGLSQSLLAEGSYDAQKIGKDGRHALILALSISMPLAIGMYCFSGWILHYFGSAYAINGVRLLHYLILAMIPSCINSFYLTINQIKKQVNIIIYQTAFLAFASLGIGYMFLHLYGLNGLGIAYALTQGILAIVIIRPLIIELSNKDTTTDLV